MGTEALRGEGQSHCCMMCDEAVWRQVLIIFYLKPSADAVMRHLLKGVTEKVGERVLCLGKGHGIRWVFLRRVQALVTEKSAVSA